MNGTSERSTYSGRIVSRHAGRRALLTLRSRRCLGERHGAGGLVLPASSSAEGEKRRYRTMPRALFGRYGLPWPYAAVAIVVGILALAAFIHG